MNTILEKIRSSRSLQVKIGILYVILALVNLLFFSVLIYENQTELLVKNFNFQSVNFVLQVMDDLKDITISRDNPEIYKKVADSYPEDIRADNALYALAQLYENRLNDVEKAKTLYEKIFTDYSGSVYAVDARKRFRILRGDKLQ